MSADDGRRLRLPAKHADDWFQRLGRDAGAQALMASERTLTLRLTDAQLCDLIADALYYSEEMSPDNTGDIDYRPAARRCLAALDRQGIRWSRQRGGFKITLL